MVFVKRFFLVAVFLTCTVANATYQIGVWRTNTGIDVATWRVEIGDTLDNIMSRVGLSYCERTNFKCSMNGIYPNHMSLNINYNYGTHSRYFCDNPAMFNRSSTEISCCPACCGYSSLTRYTFDIDPALVPPAVIDKLGSYQDAYGATYNNQLLYNENGQPVGYSQDYAPPAGVTENLEGGGWVEGGFVSGDDGLYHWVYYDGYEQLSSQTQLDLYNMYNEWYDRWKTTDDELRLTRLQFEEYMAASILRGVAISDAIAVLAPASALDVHAASLDIITALNNIEVSGGDGGGVSSADFSAGVLSIVTAINNQDSGSLSVDTSAIESGLDSLLVESAPVQESNLSHFGDSLELPLIEESSEIIGFFESWDSGLEGRLGAGVDFGLNTLLGPVPIIGRTTTLDIPAFTLPFVGDISASYTLPPSVDWSAVRNLLLFCLVCLFVLSAWRIVSNGLDI